MKRTPLMRARRWLSAGLMFVALAGVVAGRSTGTRVAPDSIPVGMGPSAIAVDAPAGHAFVANSDDDTVTMFDTRSGAVLRTVAVGHAPLSLVVDARTHRAFVLNAGSDSLSMLDTMSGAVRHTLRFPDLTALALDDQSGHLFVADQSRQLLRGTLSMVDARRVTLLHTAAIGGPPGWLVQSLAIDARHQQGWIANCANGTVSLFDTRSGRVMRTLTMGGCPMGIALAMQAGRAFVPNLADQTVRLVDALSGTPPRTVAVGLAPISVATDTRTARVFIANSGDDTVSMLDARTGTLRRRIALGATGFPGPCAAYEAGLGATCTSLVTVTVDVPHGRAFVLAASGLGGLQSSVINGGVSALEGRVTVLDAASGRVRRTLTVGLNPTALAVDETTDHLFVLNNQAAATTDTTASGGIRAAWLWGWVPVWLRQGMPWLAQPAPPVPPGPDGSVAVFDLSDL